MLRATPRSRSRISIAIAALGGQGGGVLTDWLVHTAELAGWIAQSTSIPGVAQRTGTTVYYVELAPRSAREPVLALMPVPGDVDVVVGAELMEAGRMVLRGFVTPERTTLVASTHRVYGITEKSALGDGIADSGPVLEAARASARRVVSFDMQALAEEVGGVISAVMLGAVAGAGVLPFAREHYERAIRDSDISVKKNLEGFSAGMSSAAAAAPVNERRPAAMTPTSEAGRRLDEQIRTTFPAHLHGLVAAGAARLLEYLDERYAVEYLSRLETFRLLDAVGGGVRGAPLTAAVARHLALWMSYEDTFRVADLKTRARRFDRFRKEVRATSNNIVSVAEFMHPRWAEFCESLPAVLGAQLLESALAKRLFAPLFRRGRQVTTSRLRAFIPLWMLARMGRFRRSTLRYRLEQSRIAQWLDVVAEVARVDYELSVELAECQRLVKGYGDTHSRGLANFSRIMGALDRLRLTAQPAVAVRQLRSAALADEDGSAFAKACSELGLLEPTARETTLSRRQY